MDWGSVFCPSPNFYNSVTSKPEDGWSGNPKYCCKYNTLCQPCSSLTYYHFNFQVWLIKSPARSTVQSSRILVHGFPVYRISVLSRVVHACSTDIKWSLDLSCVLHTCFVYLSTFIWTLSRMWNAQIPKYCLLFTFLVPDWKDNKGKETPCEGCWNTSMGWQIFWINPNNALKRG